jgi:glyoxylase-like metal-dependent hydrolase (beta-lactamase superfamily II)
MDRPDYTEPRDIPMYSRGWNMAHWFVRRISLGGPMDTDASRPVESLEVGKGVYQALGSSHHNLVIEVDKGLVVVDAPLYPSRQWAVLEALEERWPDKPVRHLILTHHHYDHSGGLATYVAAGIPITMHVQNRQLFFDAFVRRGLGTPDIRGVGEETHLEFGNRAISLYEIPTVHADGMFGVYLPDERMIFIPDIYSPGQESRNNLWASEALSAVLFLEVPVERLVGAHGRGTNTLVEMEATLRK